MNYKIEINKELQNAIEMMAPLSKKENFKNLSTRISFMDFLTTLLRPLSTILEQHKNNVCATIVDNSGVDYVAMKGKFEQLLNDFENVADHGNLRSYNQKDLKEGECYHDYNTNELCKQDEREYRQDSFYKNTALEDARKNILNNSVHLYQRIKRELQGIIKLLEEVYEHDRQLMFQMEEKYHAAHERYNESQWQKDKVGVRNNILFQIAGHEGVQERLINYLPLYIQSLTPMEQECINANHPHLYIYQNRHEISDESLNKIFCHINCIKQISNCIDSFDLNEPSDYNLLFKNKAVEKAVSLLIPTLVQYAGFKHAFQFMVVLMVCDDLRLSASPRTKRGAEWISFINRFVPENFQAKDSTMFNRYMKKLKNFSFATFSKDNYFQSDFDDDEFEKLSDVYSFTLTVINKVFCYPLPTTRFAPYLQKEHRHAPLVGNYINCPLHSANGNLLGLYRDVVNGSIKNYLTL